jgi:hypothetical protein
MADTITVGADSDDLDLVLQRRGDKLGPIRLTAPEGASVDDRTWAAQVRGDLDESELVATFDVDVSQAAADILIISLPHSQSKLLVTPHPEPGFSEVPGEGVYFWDLQGTKTDDPEDVWTPFGGRILVGGDATVTDEEA